MARNYKQMTSMHKDTSNASGAWQRFAAIQKEDRQQIHSGSVSHCIVHYLVDDIDGADTLRNSFPFGVMFAASYANSTETVDGEASQLAPEHILDIATRNGGAGSVKLKLNRRIMENVVDEGEADGVITLWFKNTDLTNDDNVIMRLYLETFGRWVKATAPV